MTNHVELIHSPSPCRAPRALDAVSPKVFAACAVLASPVPQVAVELRLVGQADNRCGARDEEDPSESLPQQETPSMVPCDEAATIQASGKLPLGRVGPDVIHNLAEATRLPSASPVAHQDHGCQDDFSSFSAAASPHAIICQVFDSASALEAHGGPVEDLACSKPQFSPPPPCALLTTRRQLKHQQIPFCG
jgi:hypothetical protein